MRDANGFPLIINTDVKGQKQIQKKLEEGPGANQWQTNSEITRGLTPKMNKDAGYMSSRRNN